MSSNDSNDEYPPLSEAAAAAAPVAKKWPTILTKPSPLVAHGKPINLHIWERIFTHLFKGHPHVVRSAFSTYCRQCHQPHPWIRSPRGRVLIFNVLRVCSAFNNLIHLRGQFHPVALGPSSYCSHQVVMASQKPVNYQLSNGITKLAMLGRVKTRTGHGHSTRIFGMAWIQEGAKGIIRWVHPKLPIWFFLRVDWIQKDDLLLPKLRIPMFTYRRVYTLAGQIYQQYRPNRPFHWKKEAMAGNLPTQQGKYTLLVLASPFNLLQPDSNNYLEVTKVEPIVKIFARDACYLVYLLQSSSRYRIVPKMDRTGQLAVNFRTNQL